ncbi:restriction endonuclease subunit S [Priestia megaterium]|uniref:restriction endonuclease subunit S n=1 Tax=Priestia megaterium TaxID=1404 RepID=UPI003C2C879E
MSKKKKSIEELLEVALVSKEEQPYEIPENWIWVKFGGLGEIGSSKRVLKSSWRSEGVPFYRAREIVRLNKKEKVENGIFISEELYSELESKYGVPKANDLLITGVGTIGQTYIVNKENKFYFKDASVIWFKNIFNLNVKYIDYYFKSTYAKNQIKEMSAGTTVDTYTISNTKKTLIPLAPNCEQRRITEKVEHLLNKIEKAKQLIEEAKETFELRRAAILEKAFRGELTEKWRSENLNIEAAEKLYEIIQEEKNNNVFKKKQKLKEPELLPEPFSLPSSWKWVKLSDICHLIVDGVHKKPDYVEQGIPFVTVKNLTASNVLSLADTKFITEEAHKKFIERTKPEYGDILMSKDGTLGVCRIVDTDIEFSIFVSVALIKIVKPYINSNYALRILQSPFVQRALKSGSKGTGLKHIHLVDLRNVLVPLPPLEEQCKIADLVDSLIKIEEEGINNISDVLDSIADLKASVLSKAFRGELGTNNPDEESAIELLQEILQEQVK